MVSSRRSPGSEHSLVLCLNVSSFMITSSFSTIALLLFSLLFAYVSHHICLVLAAAPPHYLTLPISLNSLDLAGVRLLSPRDSHILPYSCRCRWYQCRWRNRAQVGAQGRSCSLCCFVSSWPVVEPSWDDRGSSIWGYLILDLTVVGLCVDFGWCMIYIYVLCEVAIVSQLSLSHSCSLHGIVWR